MSKDVEEVEADKAEILDLNKSEAINIYNLKEKFESLEIEVPHHEPDCDFNKLFISIVVKRYDGEFLNGLFHGFGKVEITGGHYYEGSFQSGYMQGNGMYIWCDGLKYEGEFVQNTMTGKGKFTWLDGSIYEGDVMNSTRHGHGTYYHLGEATKYEGQWRCGKQHGKGKLTYFMDGMCYYKGDWVDSKKCGWGVRVYRSGNLYEGGWKNNLRHGYGTMTWNDLGERYVGHWSCGLQNGEGEHTWFIKRSQGSFYHRRNLYRGCFKDGKRHGQGVFYYANGSRYEGQWRDNIKCGQGKLIPKDGKVYEGEFKNNRIVDADNSKDLDEPTNPPSTRTLTPQTKDLSQNTLGFALKIHHLLKSYKFGTKEDEYEQVTNVIFKYSAYIRAVYIFYCRLGISVFENMDNVLTLNQLQYWRLLKDCKLQDVNNLELPAYDRMIGVGMESLGGIYFMREVQYEDFLTRLVIISHALFSKEFKDVYILSSCLCKLLLSHILKHSCNVKGNFFCTPQRLHLVLQHIDPMFKVFQSLCCLLNDKSINCKDSITMRQFLLLLKNLNLIDNNLTTGNIIEVLSCDDSKVSNKENNQACLEHDMGFYDFLEALIGCCLVRSYPICMCNIDPETMESCAIRNFNSETNGAKEEDIGKDAQLKDEAVDQTKEEDEAPETHAGGDEKEETMVSEEADEAPKERFGVVCVGCLEESFPVRFQKFVLHDFMHAVQSFVQMKAQSGINKPLQNHTEKQ